MSIKRSPRKLKKCWADMDSDQKKQLADSLGTTVEYLRQVFLYGKQTGALRAKKLGQNTGLEAADFRPDLFGDQAA